MEPIGIFILATICQFYSCAQNVSDSVERMQYASVAGEEYLEGEKIDTNLDDKVYFDFDKSNIKWIAGLCLQSFEIFSKLSVIHFVLILCHAF